VFKHPDHAHEVLVSKAASFEKRLTGLDYFVGKGLLTSEGDLWRRQRRMIQPAFHRKAIADYGRVMVAYSAEATSRWRDGETRDVGDDMMALTLRVVCKCLFDHDSRGETDAVADTMRAVHKYAGGPELLPTWVPTPGRYAMKRARDQMWRLIDDMVAQRRAAPDDDGPRGDLLSMLLTATDDEGDGQGMSAQLLRDELVTLFLAGHETTSHGLTWALYLLSQHPDVEARFHAELAQVLDGRDPGMDDLKSLPLTGWIVQEALRMYPPAYALPRKAVADVMVGEYEVPAGAEVMVWLYHTHHDARWYPQPEVFRPERFAPDADPPLNKRAFLPFGGGRRLCIGKSFAEMEMALVLATLCRRFRFQLDPKQRVAMSPRITLTPRYGMKMQLIAR